MTARRSYPEPLLHRAGRSSSTTPTRSSTISSPRGPTKSRCSTARRRPLSSARGRSSRHGCEPRMRPRAHVPVCRFYASGPNSHFYTADPSECNYLKGLETKQRGDAQAQGKKFEGWTFEAIAFYVLLPQNGECPGRHAAGVPRLQQARRAERFQPPLHRHGADARGDAGAVGRRRRGILLSALSGRMIERKAASSARKPRGGRFTRRSSALCHVFGSSTRGCT